MPDDDLNAQIAEAFHGAPRGGVLVDAGWIEARAHRLRATMLLGHVDGLNPEAFAYWVLDMPAKVWDRLVALRAEQDEASGRRRG